MNAKTKPQDSIVALKVGGKDDSGNQITQIVAKGNEYAIYEIDDADITKQLRVFIDGFCDDSEKELTERFVQVKQKYIEAKGMLYRSANFSMMKNRVGHALASVLASETVDGNQEFQALIDSIKKERGDANWSRVCYSAPAFIAVTGLVIVATYNLNWRDAKPEYWEALCVPLGAMLGGSLSILAGLKKLRFDETGRIPYYLTLGLERSFLACVAGSIAYVLVRAEVIFAKMDSSNYWVIILVAVVAGFSESFIPGVLERISKKQAPK